MASEEIGMPIAKIIASKVIVMCFIGLISFSCCSVQNVIKVEWFPLSFNVKQGHALQ
jgi:hypothetical protein